MILRPGLIFAALVLVLIMLAVAVMLVPRGPEMLVDRARSKHPADDLRTCLGAGLGLGAWAGTPQAMHATGYGVRIVVTDNGHERLVGLFTAGGQALSSTQRGVLQSCLGGG